MPFICMLIALSVGLIQPVRANDAVPFDPAGLKPELAGPKPELNKKKAPPVALDIEVKVLKGGQVVAEFTNNTEEEVGVAFGEMKLSLKPGESSKAFFKKRREKLTIFSRDDEGDWKIREGAVIPDIPAKRQFLQPR